MNKREKRKLTVSVILLLAAVLLLAAAHTIPGWGDFYSRYIYRALAAVVGRIAGIFPFSIAEICLYVLLAALAVTFASAVRKGIRENCLKRKMLQWILGLFLAAAVLFFLYVINCGINYRRSSFTQQEGIEGEKYTDEELAEVCRWLTSEVNARSVQVTRDETGQMMAPENAGDIAAQVMKNLGEDYPSLAGYYPEPKKLLLSQILSWQHLSGIYSPFTIEANYNGDMTDYNIPFTMCHELSHLRGFMQEEEANFIAFLGCVESEQTEFQYSGYLSGWIYAMNELNDKDVESWSQVRTLLSAEAETDVAANSAFWQMYEGKVSRWSGRINDTYLKANGQVHGVESYDRMVELVVFYYQSEKA
ncbi:MAG: DUF3810 domain-containing protein [Ruminococcus sp.]|jgi:hypothetical protein